MKFDSVTDIFFIIAAFVPGFIFYAALSHFVPHREMKFKEQFLLRLFMGSALNYAVCSPVMYLLLVGEIFKDSPIGAAILWGIIIVVVPTVLGLVGAAFCQKGWIYPLASLLRLRPINPIPTGWDWQFGRIEPCFLLVTLRNGTQLAGYFGESSIASSNPDNKDI